MTFFLIFVACLDFAVAEFGTIPRSPFLMILLLITTAWGAWCGYQNVIHVYDGAIMRRNPTTRTERRVVPLFLISELTGIIVVLANGRPADSDVVMALAIIVSSVPILLRTKRTDNESARNS